MPRFETTGAVRLRIAIEAGEVSLETGEAPEVVVDVLPLRDDEMSREAAAETRVELRALGEGHEVVAVVTQPDRAQGRSRSELVPPPVKVIAVCAIIALIGIAQKYTGAWLWQRGTFGPFVNRNHYAGFLVMGLGLAGGV